jgi:hypothetical protein
VVCAERTLPPPPLKLKEDKELHVMLKFPPPVAPKRLADGFKLTELLSAKGPKDRDWLAGIDTNPPVPDGRLIR